MNNLTALSEPTDPKSRVSLEATEDKTLRAWLDAQNIPPESSAFELWIDWSEVETHVSRLQRQLANAVDTFVTHRSCQQQYHLKYGHDAMPDTPWRFLTTGESIVQCRVVRKSESFAANN